jgi:hypothetical protein
MEDRNMQSFCADSGQTAVCVTKDKQCVRFLFHHKFVAFCDDIADCFPKVSAYSIKV